jgi:hypothetical protein
MQATSAAYQSSTILFIMTRANCMMNPEFDLPALEIQLAHIESSSS